MRGGSRAAALGAKGAGLVAPILVSSRRRRRSSTAAGPAGEKRELTDICRPAARNSSCRMRWRRSNNCHGSWPRHSSTGELWLPGGRPRRVALWRALLEVWATGRRRVHLLADNNFVFLGALPVLVFVTSQMRLCGIFFPSQLLTSGTHLS